MPRKHLLLAAALAQTPQAGVVGSALGGDVLDRAGDGRERQFRLDGRI